MIDIKAIRAAAEAATQGGWMASDNGHIYSAGLQLLVVAQHCRDKEANAKHIATANPSTVIALCDEIERLQTLCNKQADELTKLSRLVYGPVHQHKWFKTGAMEPGELRCIDCGEWGKENQHGITGESK